jgi:3-methyl-2-oxobutanoate hydroxymethyltransferase
MKKLTIPNIVQKARRGEKLSMLTAYDATFAKILDEAGIDLLLVGDSLGQVIQGHENTIPVSLEHVIYHTRCVTRAVKRAVVTADLPFMSYQASRSQALLSAGRAVKEGRCEAVKLEGGMEMADTVKSLTETGIPVMAHLGLKPQTIHQMGGYKIHGKTREETENIVREAIAMRDAGAFSIVLEGVTAETAREVTDAVDIPTIGIGAGPHCSGQVLVIYDLLGLNPAFKPAFLKKYTDGYEIISRAVKSYIEEVKKGVFPSDKHSFHQKDST